MLAIRNLKKLTVDASEANWSEMDLARLEQATDLKELVLTGVKVVDERIRQLQKRLPHCKVHSLDYKGEPAREPDPTDPAP
jgi:hypothetical protein